MLGIWFLDRPCERAPWFNDTLKGLNIQNLRWSPGAGSSCDNSAGKGLFSCYIRIIISGSCVHMLCVINDS